MIPVTGNGLLTLIRDFEGRSKADVVLAAGYVRDNGKPLFTAFYEAVLKAKGVDIATDELEEDRCAVPRGVGHGPAIYVACLASYNAGKLFGHWLNLEDGPDADEIREAIDLVIKESPEPFAEEYAIHDHQELPGILGRSEWPDIDKLAEYVQNWAELDNEDDQLAYKICCDHAGVILHLDDFRDQFRGWYDSPKDFAYELAEETGLLDQLEDNPLRCYIDWEGYWRELDMNGASATFVSSMGQYLITWS